MAILDSIKGPGGIKALAREELDLLAQEIRDRIIQVTSKNGGHIGPNLGVVELTMALHRVFNMPEDRFVFDVSHQGYVHKLLTGRNQEGFDQLRKTGGFSGFLNRTESPCDAYGAGHAGTALSAALGMATARDLRGSDENVVALIGDASLTCGITMEALNNVTEATKRLVVVLNDNEYSIDKNVGAISTYLNELITNPVYNRLDHDIKSMLKKIPGGDSIIRLGRKAKKEAKDFLVPSCLFEKYGLRYIGPIDGHDLDQLISYLEFCKNEQHPILLHVITQKGKGYPTAIEQPERFHGASPFDISSGKSTAKKSGTPAAYQDVLGKALVRFAGEDKSVVGITAAMPSGTGLKHLKEALPGQYFDVGIAEEHAVLFAAGLSTQGIKPVCAIYSTFMQRAIDPVIHDVCLQDLPVVFCMDRAGLSPNDGATHHGLFDLACLRCVPNAVIMQPRDEDELTDMLWTGLKTAGPTFIRYPRGAGTGVKVKSQPRILLTGKAEKLRDGDAIALWALGPWVEDALALAARLESEAGLTVSVVNARFVKPLDREMLLEQARKIPLLVTLEDHVVTGGFGSAVLEALQESGVQVAMERIGWPDRFVEHGSSIADLRKSNGLSEDILYERILNACRNAKVQGSRALSASAV